jgi:PKD repeat protein
VADAGSDQVVYVDESVLFDGTGSVAPPRAAIERYQWDFQNDGVFDAEGEHPSYSYTTEGTYTALLKVTDTFDQTDTDTCVITVRNRPPAASFTYAPLEPTILDTIQFYDASSDVDGSVTAWHWDFGDGNTTTFKDPTHRYTDTGQYAVTLTVTDDDDAVNSTTVTVTVVNIAPSANFTYSPASPKVGDDIQFVDRSLDPEEKTLSHLWGFGDGNTASEPNPTHRYETAGTYAVTLTVEDDNNVSDVTVMNIKILPVYDLHIELRDVLGFAIAETRVNIWLNGELSASGLTDNHGKITFSAVGQGHYTIKTTSLGQTTSISLSVFEPTTVQIQVTWSTYTSLLIGGAILVFVVIVAYAFRWRKTRRAQET